MIENEQGRRRNDVLGAIEQLGSGLDGLSPSEREGRRDSGRRVFALWNFAKRGAENLEGAELVGEELLALGKYYAGKHFDIQKISEEYEKYPDKSVDELEPGNEADVYLLSEKENRNVVKITQWNAFSFKRNLNQTPIEFLINKTILHNSIFPSTFYKLAGACYREDKYGENQFNFVFEQQYVEQLLDEKGDPVKATFEEIQEDMEKRGFRLKPKSQTTYISNHLRVSDLHLGNVLKGKDGALYYIDPVIRLLNREGYQKLSKKF